MDLPYQYNIKPESLRLFSGFFRLQGIFVSLSHCFKLLWEHIHIQVVILCVCQRNNSNWNLLHNLSLRQRVEHGQRARDRSSMDCELWIVNCELLGSTSIVNVNMWIVNCVESGRAMRVHSFARSFRMTLRFQLSLSCVSGLVPSVVGSATYWNLCQFKKQSCRVNHKTQLSPSHTARRALGGDSGWVCCGEKGCGCGGGELNNSIEKPFESVFTRVCLRDRTTIPPPLPSDFFCPPRRPFPPLCITISYTKTFDCRQSDALDDHHQNMPLVFCALIASQSSWLHTHTVVTHTHTHTYMYTVQTVCPTLGT